MSEHGLVDFFADYGPQRFRKRDGRPLGVRALQLKIHQFDLPVIVVGRGALIDPVEGDEQLRKFARRTDRPTGAETQPQASPSRPRQAASGTPVTPVKETAAAPPGAAAASPDFTPRSRPAGGWGR